MHLSQSSVIKHGQRIASSLAVGLCGCLSHTAFAADWTMWGGNASRNMVSAARDVPVRFDPGKRLGDSEEIDPATTKGVKFVIKLGSQAYGNVTVSGGKLFVGTNNETPRNPKRTGDFGVVMCFDEKTGRFLWQLLVPKLGAGKVSDWEFLGICSSPAVDGNRVYVVTNRCEVLCLDTEGLANGNDGPFKDEARYGAGPDNPPVELTPQDADIIWRFDMRDELGVFPHNIASCSVLIVGDRLYTTTSNGVDWSHTNIPSPKAPTLICLNKHTGELVAEEALGISERTLHCNWSSPAYAEVNGKGMVIFGAGDGFTYGLSPDPVKNEEDFDVFKEIWRFDCNPPHYRAKNGVPIKYATFDGPSELIGTPVVYKNRVYVAIGQDPEHGEGVGNLSCIDITKTGDISRGGAVWTYDKIERTISTVAVADDLVYAPDYAGRLHCLDADTGKVYWVHDTRSHIWGSPLVVDGKVYVGTEDGKLVVLAAGKQEKAVSEVELPAPIYSTPVVANGVLYIGTQSHLYAVGK